MKNIIQSKKALTFVIAACGATLSLSAAYSDFSTDPGLLSETYHTRIDVTDTWNSVDEDLDLSASGGGMTQFYFDDSLRLATDPVTLTIEAFSQGAGTWGQLGLMVGVDANLRLLDANPKYEWHIHYDGTTGYNLRARKDVNTGNFELFSENIGMSLSGPVKLDIVRNGADYEFYANDVLKYTASSYSSSVHDTFTTFAMTMGGDGASAGTVDNYGVIPEPSTYALLGGLFALSSVILRRRR